MSGSVRVNAVVPGSTHVGIVRRVLHVAIDAGPLHGHRTGIGNAVAWYLDALEAHPFADQIRVSRYVTSMRASLDDGERRLPAPAAVALRSWARSSRLRADRWLGRPDLVHGTNYVVPPTTAPRVVSVYDCWFLDHPVSAHRDVRLASAVLVRALHDGATALTSSQATADRLREHVDTDRIEVVHLGPPLDLDEDGDDAPPAVATRLEGAPFILSLGTIERRKNVPTLVRAFGRLAAEHPDAHLVIAGRDGDDATTVATAIAALRPEVRARVIRTGPVSGASKRWLLANAAVLGYVSLDEGFGFPLLEANAAGVPIVASTAGSIPEVAGSSALYAAPGDVDAIAAHLFGMVEASTGSTRRQLMIEAGSRNLERFSWDDTVTQTVALYRRLVEQRS